MSSSSSSSVVYEGWMIRYGRRKIGRSFVHTRYFVLEPRMLSYYKRKPQHKADKMAAFNIQEALIWKEKIEMVIDQRQGVALSDGNKAFSTSQQEASLENGRKSSSSDHESQYSHEEEDEEENQRSLLRRTTIGNGLRIFEELQDVDYLARSCSRAMKAVGVVEASCEAIFQLVMSMDTSRFEWDCSFQYGSLVEEVDGHTAILYHRLQLDWFPMYPVMDLLNTLPGLFGLVIFVMCAIGGAMMMEAMVVVLFQSREHQNCGPQPGFVRAHIESGGFNISPLKSRNGRIRTQVQHLMQIDLKGWGVGYVPSFQQHCLLHMLNSVAGLREWFSQSDESQVLPRIPVMVNMTQSVSSKKGRKAQESTTQTGIQMDPSRHSTVLEEESDEDDEFLIPESEPEPSNLEDAADVRKSGRNEEDSDLIDLSGFSGNLRRDDRDSSRDCWRMSDGNNFRVRSKNFVYDKSKIPAGKPLMELVAVDWFKDAKRMDHVARRKGCAVQVAAEKGLFALAINLQVPGTTNYSMVFYFVTKKLIPNSLLQRFVDGDDEFRNSRFKLIPSVPKGSWIVRQSVGSTPCLLGKAVDITYIRGSNYLEIDVDIGSSTVANGVLGLVCGVITTLVVDMAFLVQANTYDELPERLIGAVRMSHIELSSAIVPVLED
ncbi:Protein ENHANCED DISEASE RESISTANCE 2 [Zea mays]|uniref:Protein ENHANCED DISEASE RESISTANCE 2 n=1 Tax=Zea mays TaxID=4577 RepID=A0A1D6GTF8_MAIZE|nr:Protein ENHANCED DISEASE RESISTANCE 2 [Zea mays]